MKILAIDPGFEKSAYILYDGNVPVVSGFVTNPTMLNVANDVCSVTVSLGGIACETIDCLGQIVGKETFGTCEMIGKLEFLAEQNNYPFHRISRNQVKINLCGKTNAKDKNIRQALIDRFGGESKGIGGKKCQKCKGKGWCGRGRLMCEECGGSCWEYPPGPLYGIATHVWSALAVAVTYFEKIEQPQRELFGS